MKSYYKCIAAAVSLALLTGCSSGSIYSNVRETEELMVVQTMGFDLSEKGVLVSATTCGEDKVLRMAAEAKTISLAEQKIQDYSAAEEVFYAHTSYIALGEDAAREGLSSCLDFIGRSTQMRLDTPLFVVTGGSASELVLGTGDENYDATDVLKYLDTNLEKRGELRIFTAGQVINQLDRNDSALICAVKCVAAGESLYDAGEELTAVPDGYAIIKNRKMIGQISYHDGLAVGLLQNKAGPVPLTISADGGTAALQLDEADCTIEPILENGELKGLRIELTVSAALLERGEDADLDKISEALEDDLRLRTENVLSLEKLSRCDFLQLGAILETQQPLALAGMGKNFQSILGDIYYIINVSAEIDRSFDADREENA